MAMQAPDAPDALAPLLAGLQPGLDLLDMPASVLDTSLHYRFVNIAWRRYYELPAEKAIGATPAALFGEDPSDERRQVLARALAGETVTFDRVTRAGPSKGRHIRAHYLPVRGADGAVAGVSIVLADIEHLKETEGALRERERQLSLIIDAIGFPVTYIDRSGVLRFANEPSLRWAGAVREQIIGRVYADVAPKDVLEKSRPLLERALAGEAVTYEREALWPGRERRRIRGHMIPDRDESGTVRGVLVVVIDIDEDHRLRETLAGHERQLRFYAENVPQVIAFMDADFRYQFVNKAFERARNVRAEDVIGREVRDVLGEAASEQLERLRGRLRAGETCTYERRVGPEDGEGRWHLVRVVPHHGADGAIAGYYAVGFDIHELKLAQEKLAAQEAQLRLFTDNIPVAVAYLDTGRRYVFVNHTFARLRGVSRDLIIGRTSTEVLGEEAAAELAPTVARVMAGETVTYERRMELPSGEKRWIHGRAVPDFGPDGRIRGMYVVGHDIQDLKDAQARIAASEEELRFFAENIPEAIVYIDRERGCTFVNNVFLATRGFSREFLLGKFPKDVYGAEEMRLLAPYFARVWAGESVVYERAIPILSTGEVRWVRVKLTPRKDAAGTVQGFYVVSNDIHDLVAARASVEDKERELREVIDSIPTPMVYVDRDYRYRYANRAFLEHAGKSGREVIGHTAEEVLGSERWMRMQPLLRRVESGTSVTYELLVGPEGRGRWMSVRLTPRKDGRGAYLGYYAAASDVHDQKLVEEELRRANRALSAHFENTPLAVIEWDADLRAVRWSGNAREIFGWGADEVLGRRPGDWRLVYEEDDAAVKEVFRRLAAGPDAKATILGRYYRKDGAVIWVEWHHSALRDADGNLVSILSLAHDVSSRIQAEERLQHMATHDGLTGLPNRVLLADRLGTAILRAQRHGHRVAVMFVDLDHFKDVNDSLGHRVGDELLRDVARRIRASLRQSDLLVRLSGDEFVVMLEDLEGERGPDRVAQKILDDVSRPFAIEGHEVRVSASLGYAVFPEDGTDPDTLLKNADAAMYHAKELGRNSYRAFSRTLALRRDQRRGLETAIRRALRDGEFELHFQPILEIATGRTTRVEALLRWRDPSRGMVLPLTFIPVAEEAGLMRELGQWVFEAAARQAADWRTRALPPVTVCVNLSASQLRDPTIVAEFEAILARTGCEATWLSLEVTETSMVRDIEGVGQTLARLRRLGLRIAIDDFGTGFSSLSHLRHLPVDTLKIDKSFVADIPGGDDRATEGEGAAIVAAVTGLARGLGMDVVAEGVERDSQLAFLREQGCNHFQGYLACPPLPAGEFAAWHARHGGSTRAPRKPRAAAKPRARPRPGTTRK